MAGFAHHCLHIKYRRFLLDSIGVAADAATTHTTAARKSSESELSFPSLKSCQLIWDALSRTSDALTLVATNLVLSERLGESFFCQ